MSILLREYKFMDMFGGDRVFLNPGNPFILIKSKRININVETGDRFLNIVFPCEHTKVYYFYTKKSLTDYQNLEMVVSPNIFQEIPGADEGFF